MQQQTVRYINIIFITLITFFLLILISVFYFPYLTSKYFILNQILINGSEKSNISIIKDQIHEYDSNLLAINLRDVKKIIENEKWVKKVNIKKVYPSTLVLDIVENDPYAVYSENGKNFLVDLDGTIITKADDNYNINNYLIIKGAGSPQKLEEIIKILNIHYPEIISQLEELYLVETRRWNLKLNNKLLIKLPDANIENALKNLKTLFIEEDVLRSNIIEIDLRIKGRASLKVNDGKIRLGIEDI